MLGTLLLALSFRTEPGSPWFYPAAIALAAAWALGALVAGPPPLGDRSMVEPVAVGLGLGGLFVVGALMVRQVPLLNDQVGSVTAYADRGAGLAVVLVAVVTGGAEELFFRGALWDQVPQPIVGTTLAYTLVTLATGNVMLVFAAAVLGVVVAWERQRSGGVLAPALVHAAWSLVLVVALPRLF